MTLNRKFLVVGATLCGLGVWLVVRTGPSAPLASEAAAIASIDDQRLWPADPAGPSEEAAAGESEEDDSAGGTGGGGTVADAGKPIRPSGRELGALTLQEVPGPTVVSVNSSCQPDYVGLGVELRAWGDVLLPYTPGYPTTEPGQVWDCTAPTAFGGAIAMTHAAYLEALRPEVIVDIALDTPGRSARIRNHGSGGNPSASLGFRCAPVGWNWDGLDTWSLLHRCGEGDLRVSYYRMEYRWDRWWLVYPDSGEIETGPPPGDYRYYAFIGED